MNKDKNAMLASIVAAINNRNAASVAYRMQMHDLADSQFEPAKEVFVQCLSDSREDWRHDALTSLGFHYPIRTDDQAMIKIRAIAKSDDSDLVRAAAVRVLEKQTSWPDDTLLTVLEADASDIVRAAAFVAILRLAGYPISKYLPTVKLLRDGSLQPTRDQLSELLKAEGISPV